MSPEQFKRCLKAFYEAYAESRDSTPSLAARAFAEVAVELVHAQNEVLSSELREPLTPVLERRAA